LPRAGADEIRLRMAQLGDEFGLGAVHVASWRATYRGIFPDDVLDALTVEEFAERQRKRILAPNPPDARLWVAEGPRGIVGFSVGGSARDAELPATAGEVYAIYLLPEALGRGVGRALLAQSFATLREQGKTEVVVWVAEANVRARRFYEVAGLALDPTVPPKSVVFHGRDSGVAEVRLRGPLAGRP
jgi:ribosomal protein S18 acetylase RimI-like enzyme